MVLLVRTALSLGRFRLREKVFAKQVSGLGSTEHIAFPTFGPVARSAKNLDSGRSKNLHASEDGYVELLQLLRSSFQPATTRIVTKRYGKCCEF